MDEFWSHTQTAPSTLDNFFDEGSNVSWTGESLDANVTKSYPASSHAMTPVVFESSISSITDNIDAHSDETLPEISNIKSVGKTFGETLGYLTNPTRKWVKMGTNNSNISQCDAKDTEINDLKLRLERSFSRYNITLPPDDIIIRMSLGQPYSLEAYRILKDKISLLDYALDSKDSDAILSVVLFLRNTLKKSLFIEELKKKPHAIQVLVNYLKRRHDNNDALEYLRAFDRREDAALLKYQMVLVTSDDEEKVKELRNSLQGNIFDASIAHDAKMVKQHADLLEYQMKLDKDDCREDKNPTFKEYPRASDVTGQPLLTTLFYCSMYHWQEPEANHSSPWFLKKMFAISDKQFLWTVLKARSRVKHWPLPSELDKTLSSPGIFNSLTSLGRLGVRRTMKDILPVELVINFLYSAGAPATVLAAYIDLLSSSELKLKYGLKMECHQAVIEAYIVMRDKSGLEDYLSKVPIGSASYVRAENALKKRL